MSRRRAIDRRVAFARARAPVAVAMRVVAASVAMNALTQEASDAAPAARRSVFIRRATIGLAAPRALQSLLGTKSPFDKDLH